MKTDITESEKNLFQQAYPDAKYQWSHFRADVVKALRDYYGVSAIDDEGNKSLKVSGDTGRLPSDVVVALHYRKYEFFQNKSVQSYVEGIRFYALREKRWIINFPNVHYDNGVEKNAQPRTNGWYKRSVRMFKNARTSLVDKGLIDETLAPSYFLECLLYNVPDRHFGKSYQETFLGVIGWILNCFSNGDYHDLLCQNEQLPLFGATPEQWSLPNAVELLKSLVQLWEDW